MNPQVQQLALEGIRKLIYKKNIHFIWGPQLNVEEFHFVKTFAGNTGISAWVIQKAYHRFGTQIQVSKAVSDDLLATDFSLTCKIEDIPWPSSVVEVYFEDPLMPSIILMKSTPDLTRKWFPSFDFNFQANEYIIALMQEGSDPATSKQLSLQMRPEMYAEFLENASIQSMETGVFSSQLSDVDNAIICFTLHLALKAFVFASIPQYKPTPLTRKMMHKGGKPGVQGRPNKPSFRVDYLPKVIHTPMVKIPVTEKGKEFRGRRGHIHWYRSERFVNRKGTWDFIQPIADPHTGKYPERSIIKIRKPN